MDRPWKVAKTEDINCRTAQFQVWWQSLAWQVRGGEQPATSENSCIFPRAMQLDWEEIHLGRQMLHSHPHGLWKKWIHLGKGEQKGRTPTAILHSWKKKLNESPFNWARAGSCSWELGQIWLKRWFERESLGCLDVTILFPLISWKPNAPFLFLMVKICQPLNEDWLLFCPAEWSTPFLILESSQKRRKWL